jgi:hypothetical protein
MFDKKHVVTGLTVARVAAVVLLAAFVWGMAAMAQSLPGAPTAPSEVGPLVFVRYTIVEDDNRNGQVDCGEQEIELEIFLRNDGNETTATPSATISTKDTYVTDLRFASFSYNDIPPGNTISSSSEPEFSVAANTPNGHLVKFDLDIRDVRPGGGQWFDSFEVPVVCGSQEEPALLYLPFVTAGP